MANDEEKSNWTIKNVPVSVRKRALEAANRQDESVAVWLAHAVSNEANREANTDYFPPGQPGQREAGQPATPPLLTPPIIDIAGLSNAMQAAVAACAAPDLPRGVARAFARLVHDQVRQARGLPPMKPRRPPDRGLARKSGLGQLIQESGQPAAPLQESPDGA